MSLSPCWRPPSAPCHASESVGWPVVTQRKGRERSIAPAAPQARKATFSISGHAASHCIGLLFYWLLIDQTHPPTLSSPTQVCQCSSSPTLRRPSCCQGQGPAPHLHGAARGAWEQQAASRNRSSRGRGGCTRKTPHTPPRDSRIEEDNTRRSTQRIQAFSARTAAAATPRPRRPRGGSIRVT